MRQKILPPFITSSLAFLIYLFSLAPDLTWAHAGFDGGELITAAVTLGVPHPSGYPTYVLLGKLFSLLPVGSVAYRFNLFSALTMALAAGFVTAAAQNQSPAAISDRPLKKVWAGRAPAVAGGLCFALAGLVWSQAVIAEVYALFLCFLAAFLWRLLQPPGRSGQAGHQIGLTGLLLGLAVTGHLTALLCLPLALVKTPRRRWPWLWAGFLAGLTPFAAIFWLARTGSPVSWGSAADLAGWWQIISGQIYRSNVLAAPTAVVWQRLQTWGPAGLSQFTWLGGPLILWSWWQSKGNARRRQLALLSTTGLYAVHALTYTSVDAAIFFLPGLLLLSILLASGLKPLGRAALVLPFILLALNFTDQRINQAETAREPAEQLLQTAPADALMITPGDLTIATLWYFQHVEGQRSDLILVDDILFQFDWYRQRLRQSYPDLRGLAEDDLAGFYEANRVQRPICFVSLLTVKDNDCPVD